MCRSVFLVLLANQCFFMVFESVFLLFLLFLVFGLTGRLAGTEQARRI